MRKLLLAITFGLLVSSALAQNYTNHSVPIGRGPGVKSFGTAGPCPANQTLLWAGGTGADPTCGLSASNVTVGTTAISGGITGRVLFDNAGILGEYPITGTAGSVVLSAGPTFTGTIIASAETWSGVTTFNGLGNFTSTFQIAGVAQTFPASGLLVGTTDAQTLTNKSIAGSEINSGTILGTFITPVALGTIGSNGGVNGTLGFASGGCNATTQGGCTNNIFPSPSRAGDIPIWLGAAWGTLPGNNSGTKFLQEDNAGNASWNTVAGSGTVTSLYGTAGVVTNPTPLTTAGAVTLDGNFSGWAAQNCTLAPSVNLATNVLTVALKDNAGNDPSPASPCNINYRNATLATGSTSLVQQFAANSISAPVGATLGSLSNTALRFWVVVFNNASANVLALLNARDSNSNIYPLSDDQVASALAIGTTATSAGVFYSTSPTSIANKPYRILGYIEYNSTGLATAGTYTTTPTTTQTFGPGIRRPGEVVQTRFNATTTVGTTVSPTFATLSNTQTLTITPTSAANFIRVSAAGTIGNTTAAQIMFLQLLRNGSAIGNPIEEAISNGTGFIVTPSIILMYDNPNLAAGSGAIYTFQGKTSSGTLQYPFASTGASLELQEIMN